MNPKPRIQFAARRIELQKQKMEHAIDRFTQRDKAIFARITDAQVKHDEARAKVFSNELVEVRKLIKFILTSKLSLELVLSDLRSIDDNSYAEFLEGEGVPQNADTSKWSCKVCGCTDVTPCLGGCAWVKKNLCSKCAFKLRENFIRTLAVSIAMLRAIRTDLVQVFPEAETELGELGNSLSGILIESAQEISAMINFGSITQIYKEKVSALEKTAVQQMKDKYPDIPPQINKK
jgi:division protein CdvB (Snf7/Vps24/ESCRT-III family)